MITIVLCTVFVLGVGAYNNVCNTIEDYADMQNSENCWFDPDANSTFSELISNHGYLLETYRMATLDGYIITIFRIPGKKDVTPEANKQPVFLQHGLFTASSMFIMSGNQSLAFVLADAGYDVWLGNVRGNQYGKLHVKYSRKDSRFWDYSFHEMAMFDIPRALDLVKKVTSRNDIIYIGHSLGTVTGFIYASTQPQRAANRIKLIVAIAPALFLNRMQSPIKLAVNYKDILWNFAKGVGVKEIGGFGPDLYKRICFNSLVTLESCLALYYLAMGYNPSQLKPEIIPVFLTFCPSGTSFKTILHLGQLIARNEFAPFDYGPVQNLAYYSGFQPPSYPLSNVTIPSYLFYSEGDAIAPAAGAKRLKNILNNSVGVDVGHGFNHMDYFLGKDADTVFNKRLLNILEKYKNR